MKEFCYLKIIAIFIIIYGLYNLYRILKKHFQLRGDLHRILNFLRSDEVDCVTMSRKEYKHLLQRKYMEKMKLLKNQLYSSLNKQFYNLDGDSEQFNRPDELIYNELKKDSTIIQLYGTGVKILESRNGEWVVIKVIHTSIDKDIRNSLRELESVTYMCF